MKNINTHQGQKVKKINYIDSKNEGIIHDMQYDYYGRRLATCSQDGTIIIYDTHKPENVKKLISFQAHQGPIWQICWSHPRFGDLLASCSFDKKVSVWKQEKTNDWQEINAHCEHSSSVNCLSFASWEMGLKLASGSSDGSVVILSKRGDETWDKPYRFEAHEMGVNCLVWGPFTDSCRHNKSFYKKSQTPIQRIATVSCDHSMKIWIYDFEKKIFECNLTVQEHTDWVRGVDWLSDCFGRQYDLLATCSEDGSVILWKIPFHSPSNYTKQSLEPFDGPVWKVNWSHTGGLLAVSAGSNKSDNTVYVFQEQDNNKWKIIQQIEHDVEEH